MAFDVKEKNYYDVLEIPTNATTADIKEGYHQAKNAYSVDSIALYSIMNREECQEMLSLIEEAYSILSDPSKRKQYDQARGLNMGIQLDSTPVQQSEIKIQHPPVERNRPVVESRDGTITKLVATNRFALEYNISTEFENEIEQTTEFTGEFLKKVREYKNVDIPRMSDMTKVSKTYLINIEEENLSKLPALVYTRGFVYQYAKCLKLNPDLVATSYLHRIKKQQSEQS